MIKPLVRVGLTGFILSILSAGVRAEDASSALQYAPTPRSTCSGLGCLFSPSASNDAPRPAAQAVPPSGPDQSLDQSSVEPTADRPVARRKTVRVARPVHPVRIVADASELTRLRGLVALLPKTKVDVVDAAGGRPADFVVTATLDQPRSTQKAKLFTEQMHIVASGAVHSISDLQDKVVSFGPLDGAGRRAARKMFDKLAIPVKETPLDLDNALDGLSTGDIDAVVILAPQPFERLQTLRTPGLHFIAWPEGASLPSGATATVIAGDNYPGLAKPGESIRAVGVDAVLDMRAGAARQPAVRAFLASLQQHSAALSKRGFDLIKADRDDRAARHLASAERR